MAVFEYRGLVVASGKQVHGVRDADNPKVLRSALKREGILLTSAQEDTKAKAASGKKLDFGALLRRVSVIDVAMMTRQLATLVSAGIPLVESVSALTEQVDKLELKRVLTQVRDRLNEGSSLAKSLEPHPDVFPPLYVNMVAAGEASGHAGDRSVAPLRTSWRTKRACAARSARRSRTRPSCSSWAACSSAS